jgi:ABC-type nickel/cobalt efflux system permease component RcnA
MKNLFNTPKSTPWLMAAGGAAVLGTAAWLVNRYLKQKNQTQASPQTGHPRNIERNRNRHPLTMNAQHSNL